MRQMRSPSEAMEITQDINSVVVRVYCSKCGSLMDGRVLVDADAGNFKMVISVRPCSYCPIASETSLDAV